MDEDLSAYRQPKLDDPVPYSVEIPADLPRGGAFQGKVGTEWHSDQDIRSQYHRMHNRGWNTCLADLNREWRFDRRPPIVQGYGWQVQGYCDGYDACKRQVAAIAERDGEDVAKDAVRRTIGKPATVRKEL